MSMKFSKNAFCLGIISLLSLPLPLAGAEHDTPHEKNVSFFSKIAAKIQKSPVAYYSGIGAVMFTATSIYALFYREPDPKAQPQCEWHKVADMNLLTSEPRKYFENLKDVYWDGFVGQYYKDKYIKLKKDGTLKQTSKCLPFGVLGNLFTHLEVLRKAREMLWDTATGIITIGGTVWVINNPKIFLRYLTGKIDVLKDPAKDTPSPSSKPPVEVNISNVTFLKNLSTTIEVTDPSTGKVWTISPKNINDPTTEIGS